ncbi:DUF4189 domain-containing protein [Pseudoxanthomonas mexicana]|nr:DUF4189 domain-containing protein [Pseudoxanthomonas mexicana]
MASYAQTACPQGVGPGDPRCGPGGGGGGGWDLPAGKVYTRWKTTWGALAEDTATGKIGTSTGEFSRRRATREAVANCKAMGGLECKFIFTYKNSCAVVAQVADDPSPSMISTYQSAPTLEVASKLAIDGCSRKNEGRACQVNYKDCTPPVLIYE